MMFFKNLVRHMPYAIYAAKCELKKEVYGSYLNWLWWILEPLSFMAVYILIFGYFLNCKEPHFEAFIFIGLTVWNFFNKTACTSVKLLKSNRSIISKVFIPKYMFVIGKMLVNGFKMGISFCIVFLLMLVCRIPLSFHVLFLIPCLRALFLITFGFCCIMLHWSAFVLDLQQAIQIVLRLVFYLSGVFYSLEGKAGTLGLLLERLNPLAFLITSLRRCLIYQSAPNLLWLGVWLAVGLILSAIGVRMIQKNENSYAKVV